MLRIQGFSRRDVVRLGAGVATLVVGRNAAAQEATPLAEHAAPLPDGITTIIEAPRYGFARWGIHVEDRETGETIYDLNGGERFLAASTTKLYPSAAALTAYGADYRFETPIYRT